VLNERLDRVAVGMTSAVETTQQRVCLRVCVCGDWGGVVLELAAAALCGVAAHFGTALRVHVCVHVCTSAE
jgi:hypothetical protein